MVRLLYIKVLTFWRSSCELILYLWLLSRFITFLFVTRAANTQEASVIQQSCFRGCFLYGGSQSSSW